ncbi:MAG: hypothetical protein M3R13_09195 [Armatimonadota bacterium]|nr:hypothetical protein [Armatimonadota bacterium]
MLAKIGVTVVCLLALMPYFSHIILAIYNRERARRGEISPPKGFELFAKIWIAFNAVACLSIIAGAVFFWRGAWLQALVLAVWPVVFLVGANIFGPRAARVDHKRN